MNTTPVSFLDLAAMHAEVADEVADGFARVLDTCAFVGGPDVAEFEREFAAASGRAHCVGLANGTDAIELALRAMGIGPGDEVVIPANTFIATAEAIARAGAQPVLAEIDEKTMLVDTAAMEAAITPRTAALVPVHLYGQLAPMEEIQAVARRHGLGVLEDAAQAQLATRHGQGIGTGSVAAATSFYPGKNLGAYGDAGAAVPDDDAVAEQIRLVANHGSPSKYVHTTLGFNSRLDTLQAVVLRAKLRRMEAWNELRRAAADRYADLLADTELVLPAVAEGNVHVWHLYVVRVDVARRQVLIDGLTRAGIGTGIHYPAPVHLHQPFAALGTPGQFPIAERAATEMVSLPMHPGLDPASQDRVAAAVRSSLAAAGAGGATGVVSAG
jgi:dTDP-4-amino-4,6-dideoxygalactose transaminase